MTSPDFDRTWTGQAAEFGQVRRIPLEVRRTVCWVRRNWLGPVKVRRNPSEKGGECKVHDFFHVSRACHQPHLPRTQKRAGGGLLFTFRQRVANATSLARKSEPEVAFFSRFDNVSPTPPPSHTKASRRWPSFHVSTTCRQRHLPRMQKRAGGGLFFTFRQHVATTNHPTSDCHIITDADHHPHTKQPLKVPHHRLLALPTPPRHRHQCHPGSTTRRIVGWRGIGQTRREEESRGRQQIRRRPCESEFAATMKGEEALLLEPPRFTPSSCSFSWRRKWGGVKPTAAPFQLV
jgi:hypothetical protein